MRAASHHNIPKFKSLASWSVICVAAALLAACGSSSSLQQPRAQTGHATPSASGADAGTARAQTTPAHHSTDSRPQRGAGVRSHRSSAVRSTAAIGLGANAVQARPTRSHEDSADRTRTAVANTSNPCRLVTVAEAQSITGESISGPIEAPLGPTCIYQPKASKRQITLAIESVNFSQITRQLTKRQQIVVSGRQGYCGRLGNQMLFVQLPAHETLNVIAPCGVARRFAAAALSRLAS